MSCGNCGTSFNQEVLKVSKIKCTWNHNKNAIKNKEIEVEENSLKPSSEDIATGETETQLIFELSEEPKEAVDSFILDSDPLSNQVIKKESEFIPISEALSIIFEIPPLKSLSMPDLDFETSVFPKSNANKDNDKQNEAGTGVSEEASCNPLDLCPKCAETLTILYNSFQEFTQICKLECEIAKRLKELDTLRDLDGVKSIPPTSGSGKGRKRKVAPSAGKKRRGRPPRKAPKVQIKTERPDELFEIKNEQVSEMEIDEGLSEFEDEFYFKGRSDSDSPPDSPVNLDLNEERPRSPRPVRKSSARNKDWAGLFKDDDDEFLEEEEITAAAEGEPGGVGGNNNEITAAEILQNVQVDLKDGETTDAGITAGEETIDEYDEDDDDDDDDEEYRPDEDLEEMSAAATKDKKRRPSRRTKAGTRTRSASFKTVTRSIRHLMWKNPTGGLECLECGKVFSHKKSLERHCRTHTEDNGSVECDTCGKVFSRDDHLKRHRKQVHGEELPLKEGVNSCNEISPVKREYDCPLCGMCFLRKALDEHVNSVHKDVESPWKCSQPNCEKAFSTFSELSKHKSVHYERRKEKCEVCNLSFRSGYHLKRHQTGIHHVRSDKIAQEYSSSEDEDVEAEENGIKYEQILDDQGNILLSIPKKKKSTFRCPECKKKFTTPERLKEHLILHGIGERHKCEICLREFNHMRSKQRHMFLHSEDNPYKCYVENCTNNFFTRKEQLVRHLSNVHAIQPSEQDLPLLTRTPGENKKSKCPVEKEVQCPHCDKVVKRERLRLHMVIHTGEKRHMCDLCGQKFGLRTTLLTHIQCVHQGVRRYTCTYCGQAFKRSNHLKDHEKLHTDADSKPFVCNICEKAFRREKNLKSHMICHIGSKDFMCEICGKAFNRIDNMRAHVKTVHQGLCIRKKKPGKTAASKKSTLETIELITGDVLEDMETPPDGQITLEGPEGSSVIVEVRRQPQPTTASALVGKRSRKNASNTSSATTVTLSNAVSINNSLTAGISSTTKLIQIPHDAILQDSTATAAGALVALAVNPENPNEVVAMEQAEIIDGDGNTATYEVNGIPQRATILQLTPTQAASLMPQGNSGTLQGNFTTTFYQYTYF